MTKLKIPARLTKLVFGLSMLAALDLHADQTDERLDGLFEKLLLVSNPDFAEGWNKRATLYYLVGNTDASIEDIKRTLELEPRHFGALSGLGLVYLQQGKLALAEEAFLQLITVHPNSPSAQDNLRLVRKQRAVNVI